MQKSPLRALSFAAALTAPNEMPLAETNTENTEAAFVETVEANDSTAQETSLLVKEAVSATLSGGIQGQADTWGSPMDLQFSVNTSAINALNQSEDPAENAESAALDWEVYHQEMSQAHEKCFAPEGPVAVILAQLDRLEGPNKDALKDILTRAQTGNVTEADIDKVIGVQANIEQNAGNEEAHNEWANIVNGFGAILFAVIIACLIKNGAVGHKINKEGKVDVNVKSWYFLAMATYPVAHQFLVDPNTLANLGWSLTTVGFLFTGVRAMSVIETKTDYTKYSNKELLAAALAESFKGALLSPMGSGKLMNPIFMEVRYRLTMGSIIKALKQGDNAALESLKPVLKDLEDSTLTFVDSYMQQIKDRDPEIYAALEKFVRSKSNEDIPSFAEKEKEYTEGLPASAIHLMRMILNVNGIMDPAFLLVICPHFIEKEGNLVDGFLAGTEFNLSVSVPVMAMTSIWYMLNTKAISMPSVKAFTKEGETTIQFTTSIPSGQAFTKSWSPKQWMELARKAWEKKSNLLMPSEAYWEEQASSHGSDVHHEHAPHAKADAESPQSVEADVPLNEDLTQKIKKFIDHYAKTAKDNPVSQKCIEALNKILKDRVIPHRIAKILYKEEQEIVGVLTLQLLGAEAVVGMLLVAIKAVCASQLPILFKHTAVTVGVAGGVDGASGTADNIVAAIVGINGSKDGFATLFEQLKQLATHNREFVDETLMHGLSELLQKIGVDAHAINEALQSVPLLSQCFSNIDDPWEAAAAIALIFSRLGGAATGIGSAAGMMADPVATSGAELGATFKQWAAPRNVALAVGTLGYLLSRMPG